MTSKDMERCIQECLDCHSVCLATVQHCLDVGGRHAEKQHITTLLDCAEICQTSANFMLRGSPHHTRTCAVCAEVCRACEQECRSIGADETMRACAETCRRCAESCERMAGAMA
jgi:hypothetical protein